MVEVNLEIRVLRVNLLHFLLVAASNDSRIHVKLMQLDYKILKTKHIFKLHIVLECVKFCRYFVLQIR